MIVAPTLDLEEAAARVWDVVVVGAGPAGALAARELARWGRSVLLVDKAAFPRWKVCGCCLNGWALRTLQAVGLGDLPGRYAANPLRRFLLAGVGRRAEVPLTEGAALSRERFDAALVDAAVAAGAAFLPQTHAALGCCTGTTRQVMLRQGEHSIEVAARLVLAADGLGGRLAWDRAESETPIAKDSWIGAGAIANVAPAFYGPHTIYMACGHGGYVGLVRLEDGRLDVAAAFDPELVKRMHHPGEVATAVLHQAGFPSVPGLPQLAWKGTPPLTRQAPRLARQRLLVLGDAAGYVEPFTGEGMAWALAAGTAVTPLAIRATRQWEPVLEAEWADLYRNTVARRHRFCRLLRQVLRHPVLTGALIAVLARVPALATPFLRRLNQAARSGRRIYP
jgi:flavin-dependent dehydrogenase